MLFAESEWVIPVLVLVVVAVLFYALLIRATPNYPYEPVGGLFTKTELNFYRILLELTGKDLNIFAKVRLADLLKVKKGSKNWVSWQNKINCKHIDYVLCDPQSLEIVMAIELDDASHQREDRRLRDQFVNKAFEDARLPILRIQTQKEYDVSMIRTAISQARSTRSKWVFHL